MEHRSYKDLKVWQKADILFGKIYQEVADWPRNTATSIVASQLLRATGSISANIAEGYGRGSKKEFQRFLRIARGSAVETDNWLHKANTMKLISTEQYSSFEDQIREIVKMLNSFMRALNS